MAFAIVVEVIDATGKMISSSLPFTLALPEPEAPSEPNVGTDE